MDPHSIGSIIARGGFGAEFKFADFLPSTDGLDWLSTKLGQLIYSGSAQVLGGHKKTDVIFRGPDHRLLISLKKSLVNFSQVERRELTKLHEVYHFPPEIFKLLNLFVGHLPPSAYTTKKTKSSKRMFMDEFSREEQQQIIQYFTALAPQIVKNCLQGLEAEYCPDFLVVTPSETDFSQAKLIPMSEAITMVLGDGVVELTPRGSLRIGNLTMQRKGGDNGAETAKDIQFKFKPKSLFGL
jgi:hypothetical protein